MGIGIRGTTLKVCRGEVVVGSAELDTTDIARAFEGALAVRGMLTALRMAESRAGGPEPHTKVRITGLRHNFSLPFGPVPLGA